MRNPFRTSTPARKHWRIEAADITGRWDAVSPSDIRVGLGAKGVLLHWWDDGEGLTYDEITPVLKSCIDCGIFESKGLKGHSIRIANMKTGDFLPLEILGIEKTPPAGSSSAHPAVRALGQDIQDYTTLTDSWSAREARRHGLGQ
jgi:hypothetical protein